MVQSCNTEKWSGSTDANFDSRMQHAFDLLDRHVAFLHGGIARHLTKPAMSQTHERTARTKALHAHTEFKAAWSSC